MINFKFNNKKGEYIYYYLSGNIWYKYYYKNDIIEG